MIHWAMIETLAVFGKGISQVTTRSTAGKNFCCNLKFALKKVDEIYDKCQPNIKLLLRSEATISFVLDNYQKVIAKRTQTNNKSAITHRATASSVMRHKIASPALGSVVVSPSGVQFVIRAVRRESPYLLVLSMRFQSFGPVTKDEARLVYDVGNVICPRFLWPNTNLQWTLKPAGLDKTRPPRTYVKNYVPSMARFKVPHCATDEQLLFDHPKDYPQDFKTVFDTRRYQGLIHRKERISQLATYCAFLKKDKSVAEVVKYLNAADDPESERHDNPSTYNRFEGREFDVKAASLVKTFNRNATSVHNATNVFQSEMIKLGNPLAGTPDEFYFFPLNNCDETTTDGALRAIIKANVNMNMLEEEDNTQYKHSGDNRSAFIFGDQLTELRLKDCRQYVMKSLTKIGHEDYVDQLLKALESNYLEHDYLHETFHQMQAIYGQYWGGFLQPLVCLMARKRVSGDPMGGGKIIDHHNFLLDIYRAALRLRCKKFVEKLSESDLSLDAYGSNEDARAALLRIETMFEEYCDSLEKSENEQSRLVALFIKKVGSYLRCKSAIRNSDVHLIEVECNDWLGMWKVTGKTSYLGAGLRRIKNIYYGMTPELLEIRRVNRFPTLNKGRGSLTMDELCELHNLWLKMLPMTPFIGSVISKSKHLSLVRRCALEMWHKLKRHRSSGGASTAKEVERIVEFFESTHVFSNDDCDAKMNDDTFWALVSVKKNFVVDDDDQRDRIKEEVPVSAHEQLLVRAIGSEGGELSMIDKGEFEQLLRGETVPEDDESVTNNEDHVTLDLEGTFDEENPPIIDDDELLVQEDMMCLDNAENRDSVLKKLGNSAHKPFNKQALDDSFETGALLLADVKKERDEVKRKEQVKEGRIRSAVKYFVQERNKRRRVLIDQTTQEESGVIAQREMANWELDYLRYINTNN